MFLGRQEVMGDLSLVSKMLELQVLQEWPLVSLLLLVKPSHLQDKEAYPHSVCSPIVTSLPSSDISVVTSYSAAPAKASPQLSQQAQVRTLTRLAESVTRRVRSRGSRLRETGPWSWRWSHSQEQCQE